MNPESVLTLFVLPHVVAGTIALVLFWAAACLRKGSTLHRRAGQGYLLAMLVIIVTSVPLTALTWLRGFEVMAIFLGYLILLVALGCRNAWCAIRCRRDPARFASRGMIVLALLTGLAGVFVIATGLRHQAWVLVGFGTIGPIVLMQLIALTRRLRSDRAPEQNWWLKEHYGAMLGNGVATHIAFFQIGLMRLFPNLETALLLNLAWFGPLAAAGLAGVWISRRYRHWPRPGRAAG